MKPASTLFLAAFLTLNGGNVLAAENADEEKLRREMEVAREELAQAARRVAELSRELGEGFAWHFRTDDAFARRAMLGITIEKSGGEGVEVLSVTPGGPADQAGIQAGDRIIRIGDIDLRKEERPDHALLEAMTGVEPGQKVAVEYQRGQDQRHAEIEAKAMQPALAFEHLDRRLPKAPRAPMPLLHGWANLELVPLTEGLGEYFGTKEGLLVVRAPQHDGIPLRDGDVILAIEGRKPDDVGQAIRILRSYNPGDKVAIEIVRKQKKSTIEVEIPDRRLGMMLRPDRRGMH